MGNMDGARVVANLYVPTVVICTMTTKDTACANVRGNRSECSRACPRWKPEGQVRRVRVHNGLSFPEVRKLVEMATPAVADKSSAAAAAAKFATKSVALRERDVAQR